MQVHIIHLILHTLLSKYVAHTIADCRSDQVWHITERYGDSVQLNFRMSEETNKELVEQNTWPLHLPFRTVESIPGRLPGIHALHLSHKNDYLCAYPLVGACWE